MKLTTTDINELRAANGRKGYASPRSTKDGTMNPRQWKSWQKLESLGFACINGRGEAEDLTITDPGKKELRRIGRG